MKLALFNVIIIMTFMDLKEEKIIIIIKNIYIQKLCVSMVKKEFDCICIYIHIK